jgi:hypothetical protein
MDENVAVVVDFHCLLDNDGNSIVKELTIMDVTRFATRHWIFKPPTSCVTNPKHFTTNQWLLDNYHGLHWCEGETSYEYLVPLLTRYTCSYKYVFVKGLQKKQFLIKNIIHFAIVNLEDYGCPKLKELPHVKGTSCLRHCDYPTMCTSHRTHALREWMLNNFELIHLFLC